MSPRRVPPVHPGPLQRPGTRGAGRTPSAQLPEGVQSAPGTRRAPDRKPQAYVPFADGPPEPSSNVAVVGMCMSVVGVQTMVWPLSAGGWVFAILFTLFGLATIAAWVRLWWLWRAAWGAGFKWRWR